MIVGLGNPGQQYEKTRHNLGFMVVNDLSRQLDITLSHTTMHADWGRGRYKNEPVILARPTTFMNLSGLAVAALIHYYKIPLEQCMIVVDDMNLSLGNLRFRGTGSAGGHNGLKSIIERIGSQDFPRLRIGISNPQPNMEVTDFVLGKFRSDEQESVTTVIRQACEGLQSWLAYDLAHAMRQYN